MSISINTNPAENCRQCAQHRQLDFAFSMAFQPIINVTNQSVFGYEALVRDPNTRNAGTVMRKVNDNNRYLFDQQCRIRAIGLAAKLELQGYLSINFLPNAIYQPERCIRTTLDAAKRFGFPVERIMFELTEQEKLEDNTHIRRIMQHYKKLGFMTAIDDFGEGYAGLNLLADFQSDIIKLDMHLIRNVHLCPARQAILTHCITLFKSLNIRPLAEGIEKREEYAWLRHAGVELMQGYLFAKPEYEALPEPQFPPAQ